MGGDTGKAVAAASGKTRPLYGVNKDFDAGKLTGSAKAAYDGAWAWLERDWAAYPGKVERGIRPFSTEPLIEGHMHAKNMREQGYLAHGLQVLLDHYGDSKALARLRKQAGIIFNPAIMATGYAANANRSLTKGGHKVNDLEQPGLKRINYQIIDTGSPGDGIAPGYLGLDFWHDLDWSLQFGTVGELECILQPGGGKEYEWTRSYADDLEARMRFLSAKLKPGQPWYAYVKPLRHAVVSMTSFFWHRWLTHGNTDYLEAYTYWADKLIADTTYVQLSEGEIAVAPHRVGVKDNPAHQDTTYKRKDVPHEWAMHRSGAPHYTARYMAAWARTVQLVVMFQGAGDRVAASVGGNGPKEDNGQRVVSYRGKTYPCASRQTRADVTDDVFQISRGLATLGSAFATDRPEFVKTLHALNARPDSERENRKASWVSLALYGDRL